MTLVAPQELDPVLADLSDRLRAALETAGLPDAEPLLERPRDPDHGDWATPVALGLAKEAKASPREIAERLIEHLEVPEQVAAVEVAGPGFVNLRMSHGYFEDLVRRVLDEGEGYGHRQVAEPERINLEFVSANPTGPLHVGAGRWAALGDAMAALLSSQGHACTREYYFNDAGRQMRMLGESIVLTHRGEELGEDHYKGDYIRDLTDAILEEHGEGFFADDDELVERVTDAAAEMMIDRIREGLHALGVDFDVWFSERRLHDEGDVEAVLEELAERGESYEDEGAVWLRTTDHGDDKDRVIVRSDGRPTYFAADCAYMRNKTERGFDRLIYLLGADHHGYVGRLQAIAAALDLDGKVEVPIGQFVNLVRGGQPVRMGKRSGEFVTLDELVEEVGPDVARYHFLRVTMDQPIEFDLEEVVKRSMENPVYYVQYAHARISSILRYADESGFEPGEPGDAPLELLTEPTEEELLRRMSELPQVIADAADLRAPHRLARYAEDLAGSFHRFYTECRVVGVGPDVGRARYWLAIAARQVLANALGLLQVSAPERM